ncbi:YqaJ viral recombinase family nuclease [Variovorax atrisoli]|uniref:YqaJ viral recombinase family nuclease n=1 Tax=Variovorax atrisoli TaxID=3394203 RepID=UPI000374A6E0|nr:YqaJ viral recombinase family protein [Variovorax paradoxus]
MGAVETDLLPCEVLSPPDRSKFLGGSDAAAVMGLSPWATPVELWNQKTGRAPKEEPDVVRQRMLERGHKLEPFIRDMTITKLQDMGLQVELIAVNQRYTDAEHPFLACEIDFELRLTGQVEIGGEMYELQREHINADAKSVSGFARKKWGETDSEDVPIEYAAQFMHGLGVTGRRMCLVAALRSFDDVDIFWTLRDDETVAAMREKMVRFWVDHVLGDTPPDPIEFSDIKLLFPMDNGQPVEATAEIADKVRQLADIKSRIKDFEEAEEALTFEIADFISPNALLTFEGKEIASWKGQGHSSFRAKDFKEAHPALCAEFTKQQTVRVLRLKKGKK